MDKFLKKKCLKDWKGLVLKLDLLVELSQFLTEIHRVKLALKNGIVF